MKNLIAIVAVTVLVIAVSSPTFGKSGTISTTKSGTISTTRSGIISTTKSGTISTTNAGTISTTRNGLSSTTSTELVPGVDRSWAVELMFAVLGLW